MTRASPFLLLVVLFGTAGLYGCTNEKTGTVTRIREMETRFAKLEEDYRSVVATAEAGKKKLAQVETQKSELTREIEELRPVVAERDALRKQLVVRTGERDAFQMQLTQFRQDLQGLIARVDSVITPPPPSGTPVTAVPTSSRKPE
jgi:chromosome segregation ATPase